MRFSVIVHQSDSISVLLLLRTPREFRNPDPLIKSEMLFL